jgi:hypothetical protein
MSSPRCGGGQEGGWETRLTCFLPRVQALARSPQQAVLNPLQLAPPLQETAARGVSLVYARGGESLRARLLGQLVGVLQGTTPGTAAVSGVKGAALTGDTKCGGWGCGGGRHACPQAAMHPLLA